MNPPDKGTARYVSGAHLLQFYGSDEQALLENVSHYLLEGLKRGDGVLVIAGTSHQEKFGQRLRALGADVDAAVRDQQLAFADAHQFLGRFMVDGQPDWELFQEQVGSLVQKIQAGRSHLRAYGEMVGVLWEAQQVSASIRLEHYWNEIRDSTPFQLFCAYPINVLGDGFRTAAVDALLCAHTHLLPYAAAENLEHAVNRAMDEVLGAKVENIRALIKTNSRHRWPEMPPAEESILWLRNHLPEYADQIVERARHYYPAAASAQVI